ncbi:MAG: VPLPA-CTERM sorting domain-containing protein [Mangrovicoccus sp.]
MRILYAALLASTSVFLTSTANAAIQTFDLAWSGDSYGNTAEATGYITFDDVIFGFPGAYSTDDWSLNVSAFEITVSGASFGNGTYSFGDFFSIQLRFEGLLDPSQELVGQTMTGSTTFGLSDFQSDFNVFSFFGNAPSASGIFEITAGFDQLYLTSFAPQTNIISTPLPASALLLFGGMGSIAAMRRRG